MRQKRKEQINREARDLVIERIRASSDNLRISIGSTEYSKQEILKSIKEDTNLGKEIIDAQLEYLRSVASGAIYR